MNDYEHIYLTEHALWENYGLTAQQVIPPQFRQTSIVLASRYAVNDSAYIAGGKASKPVAPFVLLGPDGHTNVIIPGMGVTEAAELQEIAQGVYEKHEKRLKETGSVIPFDVIREKRGYVQRKDFDAAYRQALVDRIERHKRNPITDPPRQPLKPSGAIAFPEHYREDA